MMTNDIKKISINVDNKTKEHISAPQRVPLEDDIQNVDIGLNHCIAYSKCGQNVYTWGRGTDGQLGAGLFLTCPNPIKLNKFKGLVIGISAGFNHSAVITDDGYLYVWGKGMATVLKKNVTSGQVLRNEYENYFNYFHFLHFHLLCFLLFYPTFFSSLYFRTFLSSSLYSTLLYFTLLTFLFFTFLSLHSFPSNVLFIRHSSLCLR